MPGDRHPRRGVGRAKRSPPPLQEFIVRLASVFDRLVASGARYDAAPLFPQESIDTLRGTGLLSAFAPPASGGETFNSVHDENEALMDVLRRVGRADLSLGRLFEGHVNALKLFAWFGSPEQKTRLGKQLRNGALYGVWATEAQPGVSLLSRNEGGRLTGTKTFATGAAGLSHAVITAKNEKGVTQMVVVPANVSGRADLSGWRVRGMRATGSGRYLVDGLQLDKADLLGKPGDYSRDPRFTAGAWRFPRRSAWWCRSINGRDAHGNDGGGAGRSIATGQIC